MEKSYEIQRLIWWGEEKTLILQHKCIKHQIVIIFAFIPQINRNGRYRSTTELGDRQND